MAGIILEKSIKIYRDIAIYQPVINGVGGNLVGIYASRLSTILFKTSTMGTWALWSPKKFYLYPKEAFFGKKSIILNIKINLLIREFKQFSFFKRSRINHSLIIECAYSTGTFNIFLYNFFHRSN